MGMGSYDDEEHERREELISATGEVDYGEDRHDYEGEMNWTGTDETTADEMIGNSSVLNGEDLE